MHFGRHANEGAIASPLITLLAAISTTTGLEFSIRQW